MIYIFRSFSTVVNIALRMVGDGRVSICRSVYPDRNIEDPKGLNFYSPNTDLLLSKSMAFVLNLVVLVNGSILAIGSNSKAESNVVLG